MRERRLAPAFAVALLLLPGVVAAQTPVILRVAADGSGDFDTINAALAVAAAGDTVLVAPGEYVENLHIDKPITLSGDGPREEVVIVPDADEPQIREVTGDDPVAVAIHVDGVDATIEHVSIAAVADINGDILLVGARPVVRDVVSPGVIGVNGDTQALIEGSDAGRINLIGHDVVASVQGNTLRGAVLASDGATGRVEGNLVLDRPIVIVDGASLEVVGNVIRPADDEVGVVLERTGHSATVIDNEFEGGAPAILAEHTNAAHIEGNSITDPWVGIIVVETESVIRDNTVSGAEETGIVVVGNGIVAEGNSVTGGRLGIHVEVPDGYPPGAPRFDAPPQVIGNTISGVSYFGLVIDHASPIVRGNSICADLEPIKLVGDVHPRLGSNEVCEPSGRDGG